MKFYVIKKNSYELNFYLFFKVKYIVKPELLPSYIPSSLAAKILFVGEYVSVLGTTDDSDACKSILNLFYAAISFTC